FSGLFADFGGEEALLAYFGDGFFGGGSVDLVLDLLAGGVHGFKGVSGHRLAPGCGIYSIGLFAVSSRRGASYAPPGLLPVSFLPWAYAGGYRLSPRAGLRACSSTPCIFFKPSDDGDCVVASSQVFSAHRPTKASPSRGHVHREIA